jgi:hypothetical protein
MAKPTIKYIARFVPQANINDYAVDVDPQGPTEWDATDFMTGQDSYDFERTIAEVAEESAFSNGQAQWLDDFDHLKEDRNAPRWIRDWSGPFSIWVRKVVEKAVES